jgi:serine/threonine protein kinase
MANLRDPNIVQIVGVCSQDNESVSVLFEYAELGDLYQFLISSYPEQLAPVDGSTQSYRTLRYLHFSD